MRVFKRYWMDVKANYAYLIVLLGGLWGMLRPDELCWNVAEIRLKAELFCGTHVKLPTFCK